MREYPRWSTERCPHCGSRIRLRWESDDVETAPGELVREDVVYFECDAYCEVSIAQVMTAFPPRFFPG